MRLSLMNLLSEGNKGCYYHFSHAKGYDDPDMLKYYEDELRKQLDLSSNARWSVAFTIARLVRSGAWVAFSKETVALCDQWDKDNPGAKSSQNPYFPFGGLWYAVNSIHLLTFLKEKFGLCRTTVYNYLEVVDTFATYIDDKDKDPDYSINAEAKEFQFWQLIEMLPLSYSERLKVKPNWTREEILAYKKELRESSKAIDALDKIINAEEKPMSEVQQRFAKYSKDDLINLVVKLESEQADFAAKYNALVEQIQPYAGDNELAAKRDLTNVIVKLLKSFDYEIKLCGRKQGFTAFAGVVAKHILENSAIKDETSSAVISFDGESLDDKFAV